MSVRFMTHVTAQAAVAQVADQEVREQERPEVADVGRAVDRRPAAVDPDVTGLQRLERADLARERVLEADRHAAVRSVATARAEIDRPAPSSPARLPVEALTLTAPGSMPRIAAIASRIASSRSPSLGRAPMTTMSMPEGESPTPATRADDLAQERVARDAPRRPRIRGEQAAQVAEAGGTQQGIGDGVQHDVAVRVAGEPGGARDLDATQAQAHLGTERVAVVAEADTDGRRGERLFDAAQVVGQRHLEVRGFTGDRMNGDSTGLEQGGLVGELRRAVGRVRRPGIEQQAATRALGVWAAASEERSTVSSTRPSPPA